MVYISDPSYRSCQARKYLSPHMPLTQRQLQFIEAGNVEFECNCPIKQCPYKTAKVLLKETPTNTILTLVRHPNIPLFNRTCFFQTK